MSTCDYQCDGCGMVIEGSAQDPFTRANPSWATHRYHAGCAPVPMHYGSDGKALHPMSECPKLCSLDAQKETKMKNEREKPLNEVQTSLRLPQTVIDEVDAFAKEKDWTRAHAMRVLLERGLERGER